MKVVVTGEAGFIGSNKEFKLDIGRYDPLLSKMEIECFGVKALNDINQANADCVILAVSHDQSKANNYELVLNTCRKRFPDRRCKGNYMQRKIG